MRGHDRTVYFATSNRGKFTEAALLAAKFGVRLKHLDAEKLEIQAESLKEIASFAAEYIARSKRRSVVVEDAGFFVDALNGFPGPYSAYVLDKIGWAGILKLMRGVTDRKASFGAAVAYSAPGMHAKCFTGVVQGTVSEHARGRQGFGFDPIFAPSAGDGRTFAEMIAEEKNAFSHRARAFTKFCKWFNSAR